MPSQAENPQKFFSPDTPPPSLLIPDPIPSRDLYLPGLQPVIYEDLALPLPEQVVQTETPAETAGYLHLLLVNRDTEGLNDFASEDFYQGVFGVEAREYFKDHTEYNTFFSKEETRWIYFKDYMKGALGPDEACHRYQHFQDETKQEKVVIFAGDLSSHGSVNIGKITYETSGLKFFHLRKLPNSTWELEGIEHVTPQTYRDLNFRAIIKEWDVCPPPELGPTRAKIAQEIENSLPTTLATISQALAEKDVQKILKITNQEDFIWSRYQTNHTVPLQDSELEDYLEFLLRNSPNLQATGYQIEKIGGQIRKVTILLEDARLASTRDARYDEVMLTLKVKDGKLQIRSAAEDSGTDHFLSLTWLSLKEVEASIGPVLVPAGAIEKKWQELGGETGSLGKVIEGEQKAAKSQYGTEGAVAKFEGGNIYWSPHGTFEVAREVRQLYEKHDTNQGFLGYPTRELRDWDGIQGYDKRQDFEGGFILTNENGETKVYRRYVIFLRGVGSDSNDATFSALQQDPVIRGFITEWKGYPQYLYLSYDPTQNTLSGNYDQEFSGEGSREMADISLRPENTAVLAKMLTHQIFEHYQQIKTDEVDIAYSLVGHSNGGKVIVRYLLDRAVSTTPQERLPFIDSASTIDSPLGGWTDPSVGQVIKSKHRHTPIFTFGALNGVETCNIAWFRGECTPAVAALFFGVAQWSNSTVNAKRIKLYWEDNHDTILTNQELNEIIKAIILGKGNRD